MDAYCWRRWSGSRRLLPLVIAWTMILLRFDVAQTAKFEHDPQTVGWWFILVHDKYLWYIAISKLIHNSVSTSYHRLLIQRIKDLAVISSSQPPLVGPGPFSRVHGLSWWLFITPSLVVRCIGCVMDWTSPISPLQNNNYVFFSSDFLCR